MRGHEQSLATVLHPGAMLSEKLQELGMPVKEFALRCGKPEATIHEVLRGRSAVTPEMAVLFERTLGIPAHLWLSMQSRYDEESARKKLSRELAKSQLWVTHFPYDEMVANGYLSPLSNASDTEKLGQLLEFFGFARISGWQKYYQMQTLGAEFHLSLSGQSDAYALSAWLRYGERRAQRQADLPSYSQTRLRGQLAAMLALANVGESHFLPRLEGLCRDAGVLLVCTPPLEGTGVLGATRWLQETPLLQVTGGTMPYDAFWFSFFHEIGHILLHGKREVFLEGVEYSQKNLAKEEEADRFAQRCLFPRRFQKHFRDFRFTEEAMQTLCRQLAIHPALLAKHLQHLHLLMPQDGERYSMTAILESSSAECQL